MKRLLLRQILVAIIVCLCGGAAQAQTVVLRQNAGCNTAYVGSTTDYCANVADPNYMEGAGAVGNVQTLATTTFQGDLIVIYAWCYDSQNNGVVGGCTPVSMTLGSDTAQMVGVQMQKSPNGVNFGTGQGFMYYVLKASADSQTLTWTVKENVQVQLGYYDIQPPTGYTFSHTSNDASSLDSTLGSGTTTVNAPTYTLSAANAPAVLMNITACGTHCNTGNLTTMGSFSTVWWTINGEPNIDKTVNDFAYRLNTGAGSYTPSQSVSNNGAWQSITSAFRIIATTGGAAPAAPTGLKATVN